jgi:hypothetical protein
MATVTRWVQYNTDTVGLAKDGDTGCKGTRGYSIGTASTGDTFTLGPTTNRLYVTIDGEPGPYVTLASGITLDPRFVAKEITEKLHDLGKSDVAFDNAICKWDNDKTSGCGFKIFSGSLGSSSSVVVTSGTYSCHHILGYSTKIEQGGLNTPAHGNNYGFNGDVTVSGTYKGKFDEVYKIVISNEAYTEGVTAPRGIAAPVKDATNSYTGSLTTAGVFNAAGNLSYVISIDTTNGTTVGAGTGNVPTMHWTSTGSDDSTEAVELLYPDYWYNVGDWGLMVKFSDAVFNTCSPAWTIDCYKPDYAQGTNASAETGLAEYVWSSDRGDVSNNSLVTSSSAFTTLGSRGLSIRFNPSGTDPLNAGDEFYVICSAPKPSAYDITGLNYGNVTVSTESDVKAVMFEIISGAVQMSTVKFGLQSHGSFQHHLQNNNDTMFRFGTVGVANPAGVGSENGIEWYPDVLPSDIDSDTPPSYLYYTRENLPVATTADESETLGSYGLTADTVWINIKLGSSETGANSSINYRVYFDYA